MGVGVAGGTVATGKTTGVGVGVGGVDPVLGLGGLITFTGVRGVRGVPPVLVEPPPTVTGGGVDEVEVPVVVDVPRGVVVGVLVGPLTGPEPGVPVVAGGGVGVLLQLPVLSTLHPLPTGGGGGPAAGACAAPMAASTPALSAITATIHTRTITLTVGL